MRLDQVDHRLWRGSQPMNVQDWTQVARVAKRVLKVNEEGELGSSDQMGVAIGLDVVRLPIPDEAATGRIAFPHPEVFGCIDRALAEDGLWYVHCYQGVDRTGIAVARYRVLQCGWTKERARAEWDAMGSHRYAGLLRIWEEWEP